MHCVLYAQHELRNPWDPECTVTFYAHVSRHLQRSAYNRGSGQGAVARG